MRVDDLPLHMMPPLTAEEEAGLRAIIEEELRDHPLHTVRISIAWMDMRCDACEWKRPIRSRDRLKDLAEIARKHEETPFL